MSYFFPFYPKNFCREYIEIKGTSLQIVMFMATVLGRKPFMDDWIEEKNLSAFKKMCKKYRLYLQEDCLFKNVPKSAVKDKVIGGETLTSTVCYGLPQGVKTKARVHVFISRDKSLLKKGMWYPVIVKDRVTWPPRADILKYGFVLGYPACCVRFFKKYNNWCFYSYLYLSYKHSRSHYYLCNPLLKDDYYSYIYHMPCSFDCKKTVKYAGVLRQDIKKREPEFIKMIDEKLKLPFLVFYEKKIYAFQGSLINNKELRYCQVHFVNAETERNTYMDKLAKGNRLRLEGGRIHIYKGRDEVEVIETSGTGFAPESPFLIKFN